MPEFDLEQVKKLAEQLSPQDRLELFDYLTRLPDSLVKPIDFPPSKPLPEKLTGGPEYTLEAGFKREGTTLIYSLDGLEVFRSTFDPDNYAKVFFEKWKSNDKFLDNALSDEQRRQINAIALEVRGEEEVIGEDGNPLTEEQLKEADLTVLREFARRQMKGSLEEAAKRMSDNFPRAIAELFKKITQASHFAGANILREKFGVPEQKYTAEEIKTALFQQERDTWDRLKKMIGATSGGAHNVKVADLSHKVRRALGGRYEELRPVLTTVKRDAKTFASATSDWRPLVLSKYPVLEAYPDLLDRIAPYDEPTDADASDGDIAPWEIAIEIAARETIPDYEHYGASSDSLRKAAILPSKDEPPPEIKT